jgi:hypothetical protein
MDEIEYLEAQRRLAGRAVIGSLHDSLTWMKSGLPRQTVRHFPVLSLGLAVSGGFLLGRLFARRAKSEPEQPGQRSGRSFMNVLKGIIPTVLAILRVVSRLTSNTARSQADSRSSAVLQTR